MQGEGSTTEGKESMKENINPGAEKEKEQQNGNTEQNTNELHDNTVTEVKGMEGKEKKLVPREEVHKQGLICEDRQACPQCARRVFMLTMKFFQDKFFDLVAQQHGDGIICRGSLKAKECSVCKYEAYHTITCTSCDKPTGPQYKGIVAVELVQIHPTNKCLTDVVGPIKRCGCLAHVRMHLFCSNECKRVSIFKDLPLGNASREDGLVIGEKGPPMIVQQILNEEDDSAASSSANEDK